jgi:hypothetical protein
VASQSQPGLMRGFDAPANAPVAACQKRAVVIADYEGRTQRRFGQCVAPAVGNAMNRLGQDCVRGPAVWRIASSMSAATVSLSSSSRFRLHAGEA